MKCYEHIGQQIKKDLTLLAMGMFKLQKGKEVFDACPGTRETFNTIQIILKGASEESQELNKIEEKYGNLDEIIEYFYDTSDKEALQDMLQSAKSSLKIIYFLFTNFPKTFGLDQRTAVTEKLRKMERLTKLLKGKLYGDKRQFIEVMQKEIVGYVKVKTLLATYLRDTGALLKARKTIYECEMSLQSTWTSLLKRNVMEEWFKDGETMDRSYQNSFLQVITSLRNRGLEVPKLKQKIHKNDLVQIMDVVKGNVDSIRWEASALMDMVKISSIFLQKVKEGLKTDQSDVLMDEE